MIRDFVQYSHDLINEGIDEGGLTGVVKTVTGVGYMSMFVLTFPLWWAMDMITKRVK